MSSIYDESTTTNNKECIVSHHEINTALLLAPIPTLVAAVILTACIVL